MATTLTQTVTDRLESIIRNGILTHATGYEPGEVLGIQRLRQEFGISSTPVQQALRTLAAEGLVEIRAYGGARVRRVTAEEGLQITTAQAATEIAAARLCRGSYPTTVIDQLDRWHGVHSLAIANHDVLAIHEANRNFHMAMIAHSGNQELVEFRSTLANRLRVVLAYQREYPHAESTEEHARIRAAAAQGSVDELVRVIADHYRQASRRLIQTIGGANADLTSPDAFSLLSQSGT